MGDYRMMRYATAVPCRRDNDMNRWRLPGLIAVALGATLGYLAATGETSLRLKAQAEPAEPAAAALDRSELPIPDPSFQGVAKRTLAGSKPDFPRAVTPPKDAPNVLLILVDDAGFGNP